MAQVANVSSTLGSIGDKVQYMKNDEARRSYLFASKFVEYTMSKVGFKFPTTTACRLHQQAAIKPANISLCALVLSSYFSMQAALNMRESRLLDAHSAHNPLDVNNATVMEVTAWLTYLCACCPRLAPSCAPAVDL